MIRSSAHTICWANQQKREAITELVSEYRRVSQLIVDDLWQNLDVFVPGTKQLKLPRYVTTQYLKRFDSWLSMRALQACGQQVLGMLRAATKKRTKQYWMLAKLQKEGKDTSRLQRAIDTKPLVKPNCQYIQPTLDSRFTDFRETSEGEFDLFLKLSSFGRRQKILIPLRHHRVSRKWLSRGKLKRTIRLSETAVYLIYEVEDPPKRSGQIVGCDQGYLTVATLSDGQMTPKQDPHGHNFQSIAVKLARKQPGSKSFRRAQQHRRCFINWSLNQLDFSDVKVVRLERIRRLRYRRKQPNQQLRHWCYPLIKRKLEALSQEEGFVLEEVDNQFRSQRCSTCGWVRKANRKGKTFRCDVCQYSDDADRNVAANLRLDLCEVPFWVRQRRLNRSGFYWQPDGLFDVGHEPLVRGTYKTTKPEPSRGLAWN